MKFTLEEISNAVAGKIVAAGAGDFASVETDSRTISRGCFFVPLKGERFDGHEYIRDAVSKGAGGFMFDAASLKADSAAKIAGERAASAVSVGDTLYALGEIARYARKRRMTAPIMAITGSSGKSTTKEMLASVMSQGRTILKNAGNLNNRIGLPLTILKANGDEQIAILEMGTNEPGEIARLAEIASADVAGVTNVGPVHLEGLKSVEGVAAEKGELPASLKSNGVFAVNTEDERVAAMIDRTEARVIGCGFDRSKIEKNFGAKAGKRLIEIVSASSIRESGVGVEFTLETGVGNADVAIPVPGRHNVLDALIAAGMARAMNVSASSIAEGLAKFAPLAMRTSIHELAGGLRVILDCYNANPVSVSAALDLLGGSKGRRIAVIGEMRELGERSEALHKEIGAEAAAKGVDALVVIGEHAAALLDGFDAKARGKIAVEARTVAEAAEAALKLVGEGDSLLLKASRGVKLEGAFPIIEEKWGSKMKVKNNTNTEGAR